MTTLGYREARSEIPYLMLTQDDAAFIEEKVKVEIVSEIEFDMELLALRSANMIGCVEACSGLEKISDRSLDRPWQLRLANFIDLADQGSLIGNLKFPHMILRKLDLYEVTMPAICPPHKNTLDLA